MMSFRRAQLLTILFWSLTSIAAKDVSLVAHVNKNSIAVGETVTLIVEYSDKANGEPDFSELTKKFTIESRQTSSQSTFEDGTFRAKTVWTLELLPRSADRDLIIPPIKFRGTATAPIRIMQNANAKTSGKDQAITLSVSTDRKSTYINGETIVNIEIKTPLSLQNGSLEKPEIPDAIVETLVEDGMTERVENGVLYHVFNRSYAVFPIKPGKLIIPALSFKGTVSSTKGGSDPWSSFFPSRSRVTARSTAIEIDVKDVPSDYPKGHQFLPLKSLVVIEAFDEADPRFVVGKAVSRRFEIKARGTLASYLPKLAEPHIDGLQIYSEQGNKVQKYVDGDVESSIKFSHVYMPTAGGEITIPEQVIYWWDMDTDKLKTTSIRGLTINVTGGAPLAAPPPSPAPSEEAIPSSPNAVEPEDKLDSVVNADRAKQFDVWPIVSLVFLLLWIITLVLLWRRKGAVLQERPAENAHDKSLREFKSEISDAVAASNPKKVYATTRALCAWCVKQKIDCERLQELNLRLEQALFEKDKLHDDKAILQEIKEAAHKLSAVKPQTSGLLPLYPR